MFSAMLSVFFFSSRRRHTRYWRDWSSDVCSSDLRFFAIRPVDVLVPSPVGQREGVMLRPFQRFVADDARTLAADDEVCRARRVAMLFRVLAGAKQLNPAA